MFKTLKLDVVSCVLFGRPDQMVLFNDFPCTVHQPSQLENQSRSRHHGGAAHMVPWTERDILALATAAGMCRAELFPAGRGEDENPRGGPGRGGARKRVNRLI